MSDREEVLNRVRQAAVGRVGAAYPEWDIGVVHSRAIREATDLVGLFCSKFEAVGGRIADGPDVIAELLQVAASKKGYVDPALRSMVGDALAGFEVDTTFDRARVDDYAFGITRATAGIAESGSLVLTGAETSSRLGALAPWIHIAALEHTSIVATIPDAIALFGNERNTVFVTGPSKTADVEGILIQGVHGPGVQVCWLI